MSGSTQNRILCSPYLDLTTNGHLQFHYMSGKLNTAVLIMKFKCNIFNATFLIAEMCSRSTDDRMRVVVYVEKQNGDTDVIRTLFGIHEKVTSSRFIHLKETVVSNMNWLCLAFFYSPN